MARFAVLGEPCFRDKIRVVAHFPAAKCLRNSPNSGEKAPDGVNPIRHRVTSHSVVHHFGAPRRRCPSSHPSWDSEAGIDRMAALASASPGADSDRHCTRKCVRPE